MVNLALMDRIVEVDKEKKRVRVEAGARVSQLVDGLKEHGLTLQNFASIREQQVGGFVQVRGDLGVFPSNNTEFFTFVSSL